MTAAKSRIVAAGRAALKEWLLAAERHGTIYYTIPHVARSGMSRRITLHRIATESMHYAPEGNALKPCTPFLSTLWPSEGPADLNAYPAGHQDVIAKDWGFSFTLRAFVVGGCGMDMVFHLIDTLAHKAGIDGHGRDSFANRVRRASV